jgi:hypothetical protein
VQATTKTRVDLCLRLKDQKPTGRLRRSKPYENMDLEVRPATPEEVDSEVLGWLRKLSELNRREHFQR